jgi:hypothetical protein
MRGELRGEGVYNDGPPSLARGGLITRLSIRGSGLSKGQWRSALVVHTLLALASYLVLQGANDPTSDERDPPEIVIIDCPGLRCAACQLGVLRGSQDFPGVRSVEFDRENARLTITVDPGFDRHHDLVVALERVAEPIEMFRATLVEPRQVFLYVDHPLGEEKGTSLCRAIRAVAGVRSVYRDERDVLSLALSQTANRAQILACARTLGFRGELFETRFEANRESRFSEESHHLIGVLLLVISFLLIFEQALREKGAVFGMVLARLWILGGVLVFVFGDPDSWPFQRTLGDSLRDKMILQHKVLGLGMIILGMAEAARRRNKGWRYGPVTLFLAIAVFSGIMLQYHFPDMVDPAHLKAWEWVNRQHLLAAIVGAAALIARAIYEYNWSRRPGLAYAWPVLLGLEGVLLCMFLEPVW